MTKLRDKKFYQKSIPILVGLALGILIVAQSNVLPSRVVNPILPYISLKETRDSLYLDQIDLKNEISSLQEKISRIQKENKNLNISKSDLEALLQAKAKAGLTDLSGPGIILTMNDSFGVVSEDSIVHAADVRDVLNLLWGSGAEAITVNDERVVASTAVDCIVNTILINNTRISTPIVIRSIGDREEMARRLTDSSFLVDIHKRVLENGLKFDVQRGENISISGFRGALTSEVSGGGN